ALVVAARFAQADLALARLVIDDDALPAQLVVGHLGGAVGVEQRSAVNEVIDADRDVVGAGDDGLADLAQPPRLLGPQDRRRGGARPRRAVAAAAGSLMPRPCCTGSRPPP